MNVGRIRRGGMGANGRLPPSVKPTSIMQSAAAPRRRTRFRHYPSLGKRARRRLSLRNSQAASCQLLRAAFCRHNPVAQLGS